MTDAPNDNAVRKYILLALFCVSQFLDAFNVSALFSAIPIMTERLHLTSSEAVWLVSAFQLAFAAFLLTSGRICDIYNPKTVFVGGAFALGAFSLAAGFVQAKIGLFVLRALSGIAAAMTIPSSLTLLVRLFPRPKEQAVAIGVFGGSAALGNVFGLIIGALLIQYTTWSWIFWFGAVIVIPVSFIAALLVPAQPKVEKEGSKIGYMDLPGISILTVALILLIFAFTSTGSNKWSSATVLAPLIIALVALAGFFVWEARIPPEKAAFPPRTWRYPNFAILFAVTLSIFLWFTSVYVLIFTLWQGVVGWSAVKSAVHFIPIGLVCGPAMLFGGPLTGRFEKKYVILVSQVLIIIATAILPFADSIDKYWRLSFPAFILGSAGGGLLFVNVNVAFFQNTPPEIAGIVGAIFNSALQLGSAVGLAIITSIQLTVDNKNAGKVGANIYAGRAAGFWFLLAVVSVEAIAVAFLYRTSGSLSSRMSSRERTINAEATVLTDAELRKLTSATPTSELMSHPLLRPSTDAREGESHAGHFDTRSSLRVSADEPTRPAPAFLDGTSRV